MQQNPTVTTFVPAVSSENASANAAASKDSASANVANLNQGSPEQNNSSEPPSPEQPENNGPITFANFEATLLEPEDLDLITKFYIMNQIITFCYLRGYYYDLRRHNDYIKEIVAVVRENISKDFDFKMFNYETLQYLTTNRRYGETNTFYSFPPNKSYQKPNFHQHQRFTNEQFNRTFTPRGPPPVMPETQSFLQQAAPPDMQNQEIGYTRQFIPRGSISSRGRGSYRGRGAANAGYRNHYQYSNNSAFSYSPA